VFQRLVVFIFLVVVAVRAHGIVDVHDQYFENSEASEFSVFGFDFSGATGTKEVRDIEILNHTVVRRDSHQWMFVGSLNFAETNSEANEDRSFAHLRYTQKIRGAHGFELIAQHSQDQFELLDQRIVLGAGYRYEWKPGTGDERGLLGLGVIREHERYVDVPQEVRLWRANMYVSVAQPVSFARDASISLSAYAQPAFTNVSDVRAIAVMIFTARLSSQLAVKFSVDYEYDSDPVAAIESVNMSFSSGLTYTFK